MSSSPPPPYSLRPPPYVRLRGQRKSPPKTPPPSSRELLTEALRRAQHAVTLDSNESPSDVPAAIAAYDEAIGLLKRVIERRSQRSGNASEVERVRNIHDRYVERARELCVNHGIPMPSHVVPIPPPTFASAEDPPSKMKKTKTPSHAPLPTQQQQHQHHTPPNTPSLSRTAFIRRLKLKHQRSYTTDHNDDEDEFGAGIHDHDHEDDASELGGLPSLSSSPSSTSLTIETRSPVSPVHHDDDVHDDLRRDDRSWISSAACDDDLKEWGQYLNEAGENRRRLSGATAASSTGWSAIAASCEDCVQH